MMRDIMNVDPNTETTVRLGNLNTETGEVLWYDWCEMRLLVRADGEGDVHITPMHPEGRPMNYDFVGEGPAGLNGIFSEALTGNLLQVLPLMEKPLIETLMGNQTPDEVLDSFGLKVEQLPMSAAALYFAQKVYPKQLKGSEEWRSELKRRGYF